MKKRNPLTDNTVSRLVNLQLPPLDFSRASTLQGRLALPDAQEFRALHEKLGGNPFMWEGVVRIDFDAPSARRFAWEYGVRIYPDTGRLDPLCLVIMPSLSHTHCQLANRAGQQVLVVANPHIALYAKSQPCKEPGGPMPVPILPTAARNGYKAISAGDVREVAINLNGGATTISTYPGPLKV